MYEIIKENEKRLKQLLDDNGIDNIIENVYNKRKTDLDFIKYYSLQGFEGDCLDFYYFFGLRYLILRGISDNFTKIKIDGVKAFLDFEIFINEQLNNGYAPISTYIYNIYQIKNRGQLKSINYTEDKGLYIEYVIDETCTEDDYINHQCSLVSFFPDIYFNNYLKDTKGANGCEYVLEFYGELINKLKFLSLKVFGEIVKEVWRENE